MFYVQHPDPDIAPAPEISTNLAAVSKTYIISPSLSPVSPLPDIPDAAATHAEAVFWETIKTLRREEGHPTQASANVGTGEDALVIESFWPTVDMGGESGEEEW